MAQADDIKKTVRDKYAQIAAQSRQTAAASCCGPESGTCCGDGITDYSTFNDDYSAVEGYVAEADLNLGCGLPTQHAGIRVGDTVLDLGSGAGNDVFVARQLVGETGLVIGVDMTPEMIAKANHNKEQLGFSNVEFRLGDIEQLPLDKESIDVVISNCVLNLVPDKQQAFGEIYRVLKNGGHFCISDVVYQGTMNEEVRRSAELYAGCVAGSLERSAYLEIIAKAGFRDVAVKAEKRIHIPPEVFAAMGIKNNTAVPGDDFALLSITVVGTK